MCCRISENILKIGENRDRKPVSVDYLSAVVPYLCVIQAINDSVLQYTKFRLRGQFHY